MTLVDWRDMPKRAPPGSEIMLVPDTSILTTFCVLATSLATTLEQQHVGWEAVAVTHPWCRSAPRGQLSMRGEARRARFVSVRLNTNGDD